MFSWTSDEVDINNITFHVRHCSVRLEYINSFFAGNLPVTVFRFDGHFAAFGGYLVC
jgi:hypothetical protein